MKKNEEFWNEYIGKFAVYHNEEIEDFRQGELERLNVLWEACVEQGELSEAYLCKFMRMFPATKNVYDNLEILLPSGEIAVGISWESYEQVRDSSGKLTEFHGIGFNEKVGMERLRRSVASRENKRLQGEIFRRGKQNEVLPFARLIQMWEERIDVQLMQMKVDGNKWLGVFAMVDGKVVGTATVGSLDKDIVWVSDLFVQKKFRRKGVATAMLEAVMGHCAENDKLGISLNVGSENDKARRLYEGMGFVKTFDYDDGENSMFAWRVEK